MPWLKFNKLFNYEVPNSLTTIVFREGYVRFVPRAIAQEALAKGVAEPTTKPERTEQ